MKFLYKGSFAILFLLLLFPAGHPVKAQIKLIETFEGAVFPPDGWSSQLLQGSGVDWKASDKYCRSGEGCAVSEFDTTYGASILITKRFVPSAGDSLVFYLRQTFYKIYGDTLRILASTSDSLPGSFGTQLMKIYDGNNYPPHQLYRRYAISLDQFAGETVWMAFQHINTNGEILRLDDVSVGNRLASDVSVVSLILPQGPFAMCSSDSMVMQAVVRNEGTQNHTGNITISLKLTGPQTTIVSTSAAVMPGESVTVTFPSVTPSVPGEYLVSAFTQLPDDQYRQNDTVSRSFSAKQYSSGMGDGGYFFSTSIPCGTSGNASPQFHWKDTSNSISLLENGADVSQGRLVGNTDDGYFALGEIVNAGKRIKFFESVYDSVYISTNGFIALSKGAILNDPFPPDTSAIGALNAFAIAPLWMDYDNGNPGSSNRISYKFAGNYLLVTFDKMKAKSGDSSDYASFQVMIELVQSDLRNSRILFQYSNSSTGPSMKEKFLGRTEPACFSGLISGNDNSVAHRHKSRDKYFESGTLYSDDLALQYGPVQEELNARRNGLTVLALLEGYMTRSDTVTFSLHDFENPQRVIESHKAVVSPGSVATFALSFAEEEAGYFIRVMHRNSIETWSKDSALYFRDGELIYDFSRDSTMAYGNNLAVFNGRAYIFSGDVNNDGLIDITDGSAVSNDAHEYVMGFVPTDLNGDRIVDSSDMIIADRNSERYVVTRKPEGGAENISGSAGH
ncbi:MAG: choice-of-anchor J domain-containing protein [Ignavibacteria bacterium]|nr:choice-of-anchor J domain-containing protein [Ignavibacteria bacterium]